MANKQITELDRALTSLDEDLLILEKNDGTMAITKGNLLKEIKTDLQEKGNLIREIEADLEEKINFSTDDISDADIPSKDERLELIENNYNNIILEKIPQINSNLDGKYNELKSELNGVNTSLEGKYTEIKSEINTINEDLDIKCGKRIEENGSEIFNDLVGNVANSYSHVEGKRNVGICGYSYSIEEGGITENRAKLLYIDEYLKVGMTVYISAETESYQVAEITSVDIPNKTLEFDKTLSSYSKYMIIEVENEDYKYEGAIHVEGMDNFVSGICSHAEGQYNSVLYEYCHAEGFNNVSAGYFNHVGGESNLCGGDYSTVTGWGNVSWGYGSNVCGEDNEESGDNNVVCGEDNVIYGDNCIAGGTQNTAPKTFVNSVNCSIISGRNNNMTGSFSGVIGKYNRVNANSSFVGGEQSYANSDNSLVFGYYLTSRSGISNYGQVCFGKYNIGKTDTIFEIGRGTSTSSRKNSLEILDDGTSNIILYSTSGYRFKITVSDEGAITATKI